MNKNKNPTSISTKTIKKLFAVSGNSCCFPDCESPLYDLESKTVIGEVCHIKGRRSGSPRFDPEQSEIERQAYDNLLLMCPIHHKIIDSQIDVYTGDKLIEIKKHHEKQYVNVKTPHINNLNDFLLPLEEIPYKMGSAIFLSHRTIHKFITDIGVFYKLYNRVTDTYFLKSFRSAEELSKYASKNITTIFNRKESENVWLNSVRALEIMDFEEGNIYIFDLRSEKIIHSKEKVLQNKNPSELDLWRIDQYIRYLEAVERCSDILKNFKIFINHCKTFLGLLQNF